MRKLVPILLIVALICTISCTASINMTPKAKLLYMYQVMNAQMEDYQSMAKMPNLTESQKKILRLKKPILETLQSLIPLYDQSVQQGAPSASTEQQIYDLLNQLQTM